MTPYIRPARPEDLEKIQKIFQDGRQFLKEQGLPQWQNGHGPHPGETEQELRTGRGYVLIYESKVCGYATLTPGPDGTPALSEGSWDPRYQDHVVIHRVALRADCRGRGLGSALLRAMAQAARLKGYRDIRIDTNPGNKIMRKIIGQTGFVHRGTVHLPIPEGRRLVYQLLLD